MTANRGAGSPALRKGFIEMHVPDYADEHALFPMKAEWRQGFADVAQFVRELMNQGSGLSFVIEARRSAMQVGR